MALATPTVLDTGSSEIDQDVYTTGVITATPDKTLVLVVANHDSAGPATPTVTGVAATWDFQGSLAFSDSGAPTRRISVWTANDAAPTAEAITLDFTAAGQQGSIHWHVLQLEGDDILAPVVQLASNYLDVAATGVSVNLAAFGSSSNGVLAFLYKNNSAVVTRETGYTELSNTTLATPNTSLTSVFRDNPDVQVDFAWTGSLKAGAVAIEIKSAVELTATQKSTYMGELERVIGGVRRVVGRLTAHRLEGTNVDSDLARVRAVYADAKGKYDELVTDTTDVDDLLTVAEADVANILTQIGDIGSPAPEPVALLKGLFTRESLPPGGTVAGYHPIIDWADLQANEGGPIGGAGKTQLDALIANQATTPFRLRLFSGYAVPQWLKDIIGSVPIHHAQDSNPDKDVVKWWDPRLPEYYADLQTKLAALYDGQLSCIFEAGTMVVYAEPCLIQASDAENRATLLANGYTKQGHVDNFKACFDAMTAWKQTRIACSYNNFSYVKEDGTAGTDATTTDILMEYHRELFGERAILQNNSIRVSFEGQSIYARIAALGAPISMQTANTSQIDDLAGTIDYCIDTLGAHLVELPGNNYPGLLTQAQLDDFDARLRANP